MKKFITTVAVICVWIWKTIRVGFFLFINFMFLAALAGIVLLIIGRPAGKVPSEAALVVAPEGNIVEQRSVVDPLARMVGPLMGGPKHEETPLQDILDVINAAATDDRIKVLLLSPSRIGRVSLNQLRDIGQAVDAFKNQGKVVIAADDFYNQGQYYLASYADEVYLNPMGSISLHGFGLFRLYFKQLLDRLLINIHVFRVGTYKSALEPLLRDNMSPAAREANQEWLNSLWTVFCQDVARQRGLTVPVINEYINTLDQQLEQVRGNNAQLALKRGLIDGVKTRNEVESYLRDMVGPGRNGEGFKKISMYEYLEHIPHSYAEPRDKDDTRTQVGIIVAQGNIVTGHGMVGQIGAEDIIQQIRKARMDNRIGAVVLRIDSGGGSAFASELIRQELLELKKSGKPLVVSMASMAASGAYWLSADADRILASPVTLTGSIGIFGALPTFEQSLAQIGIHDDGTGTTNLAGAVSPTRPLPPVMARAIQLEVEHGYKQFLAIVAQGRKLPLDAVEKIAEGRVWAGSRAISLGLVDREGSLADAVNEAADLAGLQRASAIYINQPATFLQSLEQLGQQKLSTCIRQIMGAVGFGSKTKDLFPLLDMLSNTPDPGNLYAFCLLPADLIDF